MLPNLASSLDNMDTIDAAFDAAEHERQRIEAADIERAWTLADISVCPRCKNRLTENDYGKLVCRTYGCTESEWFEIVDGVLRVCDLPF